MADYQDMATPISLAGLIRRLRDSIGVTQEELADRAGISVRTVSDIERGLRRSLYRDTAQRLAEALEIAEEERPDFAALARGRIEKIRSGSPFSPSRDASSLFATVPLAPTRLIDRERELDILMKAFADRSIRLLTLTGPGGIGKTRVAAEAALRAQGMFRDGLFFLSLSSVQEADRVVPLMARALGLVGLETPNVAETAEQVGDAEILVVLDTFEHLIESAVALDELLASCSGLTLLVTSREALHLRVEHVIPLSTLELPAEGDTDLSSASSTALFLERARAAKPDLRLDEQAARSLVDICRRLQGLPLALELAASRVQHMPLLMLRDQLGSRLRVLTRGPADLPPRQRTMRDTIAWSYELLDPTEQSLFRTISVFAGGWTLEAADKVWGSTTSDRDTLETISALVDKSLVLVADPEDPEPRYDMLGVIAEYAAEQREQHDGTQVFHAAHSLFFLSLAERAEHEMGGSAQELWYRRLLLDHDNLRQALRWTISQDPAEVAVRIAGALWQFWRAEGHFSEGRAWVERALEVARDTPKEYLAKALWGAAWLAFHQDDLGATHAYSERLLALYDDQDRTIMRRNALTIRGMLNLAEGRYEAALVPLAASVEICEPIGRTWHLATSKLNLALASMHARRSDDASRLLQEALDLYLELGDERFIARVYVYLGHLALLEEEEAKAKELFSDGLRRFSRLRDQAGIAEALEGLASLSAVEGRTEQAALIWGTATGVRETTASKTLPFERALIDRWLDETRATMGEAQWELMLAKGQDLDLEDAIARATAPN
jgi:predicted ATPase/DNA-binding XRE family transcriptional regulator